eukprot:scaffold1055_cov165-Amphora_coffeaeformis.AAC.21
MILYPTDDGYNRGGYSRDDDHEESHPPPTQNGAAPRGNDSVADEKDLLDLDNWDDVPGQGAPPPGQPGANPYQQGGPPPPQSPYQQGPPQSPYQQGGPPPGPSPYQQGYPGGYPAQQQQQQEPNYAGAIVPTQAPAAYPGAPSYPGSQYPGAPSPYGSPQGGWQTQSPPHQQHQQYNYGQPQPYQQQGF